VVVVGELERQPAVGVRRTGAQGCGYPGGFGQLGP
jgi:hypothetical protein